MSTTTTPTVTEANKLGLFSAIAIVSGSMIGSGIFLVTPDTARVMGTGGLMMAAWALACVVTFLGARAYSKLAAYLPQAGGQYVFLKEAFGPIPAFLYGWVFFWIIQTGVLAAVSMAFAKYVGVLWPLINDSPLVMLPLGLSISTEKLLAMVCLAGLTWINSRGLTYGALLQNVFTVLKVAALLALIGFGLGMGNLITTPGAIDWSLKLPESAGGFAQGLLPALAVATVGPLFSSDSWAYVTFLGGDVKNPSKTLPQALFWGTLIVLSLYLLANLAYLNVLPLSAIQTAPQDKVAASMFSALVGPIGSTCISVLIMVSTFGCLNGMLLSGARVFYALAKDGLLFKAFAKLDPKTQTPNTSLLAQLGWACCLLLSGSYSQLLGFTIFTALVFYIATIAGLMRLGKQNPEALQMKTVSDWLVPVLYLVLVCGIAGVLLVAPQTATTSWIGLGLTFMGLPFYFWMQGRQKVTAPVV